MRRLGKIKISEELLLGWLQYPSAIIRGAQYNAELQAIDIILESTEMPEVDDGNVIPLITPTYIKDIEGVHRIKGY